MQLSGDRPLASGDSLLSLYIQCGSRGLIPIKWGLVAWKWRVGGKVQKVGGKRPQVGGKHPQVGGKHPQVGGKHIRMLPIAVKYKTFACSLALFSKQEGIAYIHTVNGERRSSR